LATLPVRAFGS
jgi:hypothetical protein